MIKIFGPLIFVGLFICVAGFGDDYDRPLEKADVVAKQQEIIDRLKQIEESDNPAEERRKLRVDIFEEIKRIENLEFRGVKLADHVKEFTKDIPDKLPPEDYIPIPKKPMLKQEL